MYSNLFLVLECCAGMSSFSFGSSYYSIKACFFFGYFSECLHLQPLFLPYLPLATNEMEVFSNPFPWTSPPLSPQRLLSSLTVSTVTFMLVTLYLLSLFQEHHIFLLDFYLEIQPSINFKFSVLIEKNSFFFCLFCFFFFFCLI